MDKDKPSNIGSPNNSKEVVGIVSVKSDDNIKIGDHSTLEKSQKNVKVANTIQHPENIDFVVNKYLEADRLQKILDIGEESIE